MKVILHRNADADTTGGGGGEQNPEIVLPTYQHDNNPAAEEEVVNDNPDDQKPGEEKPGETQKPGDTNGGDQNPGEQKPAETTEVKPANVSATDWKAALKTADKYEALKELGYDDWTIDMLKYKEATGNVDAYVDAKRVDYTKLDSLELIKMDLRKKYSKLSEGAFQTLVKKETSKYYLDRDDYSEDSEEAVLGKELMDADAEEVRNKFIEDQKKFKAPEKQPDAEAQQQAVKDQERRGTLHGLVMANPAVKLLQEKKTITTGTGEDSFTYAINDEAPLIQSVVNTLMDSDRTNLDGLNLPAFVESLVYASDPNYRIKLAEHHQAIGRRKLQAEMKNADSPDNANGFNPDKPVQILAYS
jgi:hypothetical protein